MRGLTPPMHAGVVRAGGDGSVSHQGAIRGGGDGVSRVAPDDPRRRRRRRRRRRVLIVPINPRDPRRRRRVAVARASCASSLTPRLARLTRPFPDAALPRRGPFLMLLSFPAKRAAGATARQVRRVHPCTGPDRIECRGMCGPGPSDGALHSDPFRRIHAGTGSMRVQENGPGAIQTDASQGLVQSAPRDEALQAHQGPAASKHTGAPQSPARDSEFPHIARVRMPSRIHPSDKLAALEKLAPLCR